MFNSAAAGDFYEYQIANSCRFDGSSSVLTKTWGSAGTDDDKWAISVWVKGHHTDGTWGVIASCAQSTLMALYVQARSDSDAHAIGYYTGNGGNNAASLALGRDVSAWRHIVMIYDSSQGAGADRIKIYNNGEHWTTASATYWGDIDSNGYPDQNTDSGWGMNGNANEIGRYQYNGTGDYYGYMADFVSIDGAASISDFGETKNGVWIPSDPSGLTFGTNGFWLKFTNASDFGEDFSGNNNDWSTAGFSTHDQMKDSPTFDGSSNGGNFATLLGKQLRSYGRTYTMSEGNLQYYGNHSGETSNQYSTMGARSGKWYAEFLIKDEGSGASVIGIAPSEAVSYDNSIPYTNGNSPGGMGYRMNGNVRFDNTDTSSGYDTYTDDDVIQVAMDIDNTKVWFGKNNTWQNSGDPAAGSNASYTDWTTQGTFSTWHFAAAIGGTGTTICNFGQEGTFVGEKTAGGNADGSGYGNFLYAPPSGFLAMCSGNLTTGTDPADDEGPYKYFVPKIYTGDGASTLTISGLEHQPDFTWIKNRDATDSNCLFDSTRGVTYVHHSDATTDSNADADTLKSWTSDGFTVGADDKVNTSSEKYVSWNWKCNGGTTSSNTNGDITSTVQANTDAGFSIVKWVGNNTADQTIGHGLSKAPQFIISKPYETGSWSWHVYHYAGGTVGDFNLNNTNAFSANTDTYGAHPSATVFTVGDVGHLMPNNTTTDCISYCWHNVEGFSRFGTYEGSGNANGSFVYTGFRPAWIMTKSIDSTSDWNIFDDLREGYNVDNDTLVANSTAAEATTDMIDILSNGFKCRIATDPNVAETYIFAAFAHNPFKYAVAR